MCSGSFAKSLGITLIPRAILCVLSNILLFFPGGLVADDNDHITKEVWYFGGIMGSGVLMTLPALVFLGLKNNDCCGCCGNESCGKRFAMFTSIIFAAVGVLGAGYSFIVSAVAIHNGPMCLYTNGTTELWTNPFVDGVTIFTSDYLNNHTLLKGCKAPEGIVTWHLTLFSMLLVMGLLQDVLCAIQIINGLIGAICGDCCGSTDGAVCGCLSLSEYFL